MSVRVDGVMVMTVVGVVAVGGLAYFLKKKGGDIADALNPASDKNIAYRSVNNTLQGALGLMGADNSGTLGTTIYDATHVAYDPNDPSTAGEPFSWAKTASWLPLLNPTVAISTVATKAAVNATDNFGLNTTMDDYDMGGKNFGVIDAGSW